MARYHEYVKAGGPITWDEEGRVVPLPALGPMGTEEPPPASASAPGTKRPRHRKRFHLEHRLNVGNWGQNSVPAILICAAVLALSTWLISHWFAAVSIALLLLAIYQMRRQRPHH